MPFKKFVRIEKSVRIEFGLIPFELLRIARIDSVLKVSSNRVWIDLV